jgi:multidrug efflux system membrane fusion protein
MHAFRPAPDGTRPWHAPAIRRNAILAVVIVALAVSVVVYERRGTPAARGGGTPARDIPVVAAMAHRGDIGVYVTGLGAVTPVNTIAIKARVDGQLMTVSYQEGQVVRKGDPLVEIDSRPYQVQLAQAEAQLIKDQAALQNAQADLQRYETLIVRNAIAQQVLATQRATVAQDEGALKADQANIDNARLNISYCHIAAPLTGRVGLRLVDPGNMVSAAAGTPLMVITQTQPISIIFTIPEQQLAAVLGPVRGGQHLHVDAFDRDMQTVLASGDLTTIDNEIDQTTGTLKLRATVPNKDEALFPNQFVNARLLVQQKKGVTLVPNAAVQRNASATFVYVVKPDHAVSVRTVTLGTTTAEESEVVSGVAPDEVVVIQGVDKLQEGSRVATEMRDDQNVKASGDRSNETVAATSGQAGVSGPTSGRTSRASAAESTSRVNAEGSER